MKLIYHFSVSLILSLILFPFFSYPSFMIFIGGFLVDLDHWIFYAYYYKKFSLKEGYHFFSVGRIQECKGKIFLFHTIEFLVLLIVLSIYYKLVYFILLGFITHILMDWSIELSKQKSTKELSIIYNLLKK